MWNLLNQYNYKMTKLSNIRNKGRYKNLSTGQKYNVKQGRNMQRGTDVLYYLYMGKRIYISDKDFYDKSVHEKNSD